MLGCRSVEALTRSHNPHCTAEKLPVSTGHVSELDCGLGSVCLRHLPPGAKGLPEVVQANACLAAKAAIVTPDVQDSSTAEHMP